MFSTRLYIQFSDKRIKVSSPQIDQPYETTPFVAVESANNKKIISAIGRDAEALQGKSNIVVVNPFAHPRIVIGDFTIGEKLLQYSLRSMLKSRWFVPVIIGIIHPERKLEGGLTQIEHRALRELCLSAGCRQSAVHDGPPLSLEDVAKYEIRA